MKGLDDPRLILGSDNIFRDLGDPDADLKHAKAVLAARIIEALEKRELGVRNVAELTGFAAADFSRIRNANLGRFTLDRLMRILAAIDHRAEVTIQVGQRSVDGHCRAKGRALGRVLRSRWRPARVRAR